MNFNSFKKRIFSASISSCSLNMFSKILIFISLIVFSVTPPPVEADQKIDLYYSTASPPSRAVRLAAKLIGIEFNLKHIDVQKGENKTPEFTEINPDQKIPTIVDEKFTLPESHSILIYLAEKYNKRNLYPENIQEHALVNERLFFDATRLYLYFAAAYYPLILKGIQYTDEQIEKLDQAFRSFDRSLGENEYAAGNQLTVADLSFLATVTTIEAVNYNIGQYPNVIKWLARAKAAFSEADYKEANGDGVAEIRQHYLNSLKKFAKPT